MARKSKKKKGKAGAVPGKKAPVEQKGLEDKLSKWQVDIALVLGAVILSVLFRYFFWQRFKPVSVTDMAFYVDIARSIRAGEFSRIIHFHYGALYPFFIMMFHSLSGLFWGDAARWVNIISGSLTIIPLYIIARQVFNRRTAVFALLLSGMAWADVSAVGYAEAPFGLFAYLAVMMTVLAWKRQGWLIILASLTIGLASLVKAEGSMFWVLLFLIYLWKTFRNWKAQIPYYVGYLLIYLVVISPYLITYYQETGKISFNPKSRTLIFVHNEDYSHFLYDLRSDERGYYTNAARIYLEGDRDPVPISLSGYIRENFSRLIKDYFGRLYFNFTEMMPYLCYLILPLPIPRVTQALDRLVPLLAALVLVLAFIRTRKGYALLREEAPLYMIAVVGLAAVALYNPWSRFFYSVFPILILAYAKGLDQLLFWVERGLGNISGEAMKKNLKVTVFSISIALAVVILSFHIHHLMKTHPNPQTVSDFKTKAEIVRWLGPRIKKEEKIMGYGLPNRVSYFLDMPPEGQIILPLASIDDAIRYAKQEGVKYLIVESHEVSRVFKQYARLFDPEFSHPELRREYVWMKQGQEAFVIYTIVYSEGGER